MTPARTELETQMQRRVRRHMLTAFGGFFVAIALLVVAGALSRAAGGAPWTRVFALLPILAIPVIGFASTWKNLRCPACEGTVIFQASANYSLFYATAPKTCRRCGAKIFADDAGRRFMRGLVVAFAIGMGLAIVSAVASAVAHRP